MRFPKTVPFRRAEVKIYGKSRSCPFYRVSGYVTGKRQMSKHTTYSSAKKAADKLVRQIAKGDHSAALTPQQASEALAALERLRAFKRATGRRVSLLGAVSEFAEAATKVNGHGLSEVADSFLRSEAKVTRKDVAAAVEEFIAFRTTRTVPAKDGKRPRLSPEYHSQTTGWLREFGGTFPGEAVSGLTKAHLATYMAAHGKAAPKTRNARRGVVKMFLRWCVEKDWLSPTHRLFETDDLKHEPADTEEIDYYRPREFAALLAKAESDLLPVLALAGLAGIRFKEICRLTWEDVFRVPDHVEIAAFKAKTRSRRLVTICPALAAWLEQYRRNTGAVWPKSYDMLHLDFDTLRHEEHADDRGPFKIPNRRNGLRHAYISCHFALHSDEGRTAAQAGNSPEMVHKHYKGLVTEADAKKWFAVKPTAPENVVPMRRKQVAAPKRRQAKVRA